MEWNPRNVLGWIKQLEKCPPGAVGDAYAKDINSFLKDYKRAADLVKAHRVLFKRGQKAVVDYQKKKSSK